MLTSKRLFHPSKRTTKKPNFDTVTLFTRLGLQSTDSNIINNIKSGFSVSIIDNLAKELNLPQNKLLKFINISPATFARRRIKKRLSLHESNRVFRLTSTYRDALELFEGNINAAKNWLNESSKYLEGKTPLEFQDTEAGYYIIRDFIGRLENGVIT